MDQGVRMIKLSKDYYLDADTYNLILKKRNVFGKKSKKCGQEYFDIVGFYSSFKGLAKGIVRQQIHDIDFDEVTTLGQLAEKFAENISDVMSTMGVSVADRAVERLLNESGTRICLTKKNA